MSEKFKIALVNPQRKQADNFQPTGICYLSSYLKKYLNENIEIRIFKTNESNLKSVIDYKPDIAGFTSYTHNFNLSVKLASLIKDSLPDTKLILGGSHISMAPWSMPDIFDLVITGEGEEAFLHTVRVLINGGEPQDEKIPGLLFKDNGNPCEPTKMKMIDPLDKIPFPDRESLENIEQIITTDHPGWFNRTGLRTLQVTTSRGCPFRCIFCQPSYLWDKFRMHSPEYIAGEIDFIRKKYGINAILIEDDLFTAKKSRLAALIDLLGKKGVLGKIIYFVAARASQVDKEWAELFSELGVVKVEFGIESGSDRIAEYLKGSSASTEINKKAVSVLNENGIYVAASFIAGSPPERLSDLNETFKMIKWIKKQNRNNSCGINIATPLPGTGLWDHGVGKGIINVDNIDWEKFSTLDTFPKTASDMIYLNENIPADLLLRKVRRMNMKLLLGTPAEFIKAMPRRIGKRIKKTSKKVTNLNILC